MNILTICGSLRAGSYNASLARTLPLLAPPGVSISMAPSVGEFPLYNQDAQMLAFPDVVTDLGECIRSADGVIIVSPEYNYSIAGVLKNAIDWLSRLPAQPFKDKAIALQSVSTGILGGARAQYHLRQVMVFVEARVFNRPEVIVANAKDKFDAAGTLVDAATRDMVTRQLAAFADFISPPPR